MNSCPRSASGNSLIQPCRSRCTHPRCAPAGSSPPRDRSCELARNDQFWQNARERCDGQSLERLPREVELVSREWRRTQLLPSRIFPPSVTVATRSDGSLSGNSSSRRPQALCSTPDDTEDTCLVPWSLTARVDRHHRGPSLSLHDSRGPRAGRDRACGAHRQASVRKVVKAAEPKSIGASAESTKARAERIKFVGVRTPARGVPQPRRAGVRPKRALNRPLCRAALGHNPRGLPKRLKKPSAATSAADGEV